MRDIVLVTDSKPDRDEVRAELAPLVAAFEAKGEKVRLGAWDDPAFDWISTGVALLRTPWNYHLNVSAFCTWAKGVPNLLNPAHVVTWNAHKTYLRDLEEKGVPVVPTEWLTREVALRDAIERRGWDEVVLKPAVSAGSFRTRRFAAKDAPKLQPLLTEILGSSEAMLQPYLPSVESSGERSMVFFSGALSHVVKRHPPLSSGLHGGVRIEPEADEVALATQTLAAVRGGPPLYARVDVARDANGRACLMELELIEPSFFFDVVPDAAARLVDAVLQRVPA